ncbi:MAG: DNA topoisomerase VI subunit B [Nanoarchaeota archaeon]
MTQTKLVNDKGEVKQGKTIADELATKQREISISEFFLKNRHLLGFDNPKKALLTAVKEAVDNSLDACEEAKYAPELKIIIEPISDDRYRIMVEDNGPGIVKEQVGKVFGKLLYGSKFHRLKCSRGQQGIGISAAAMYGQLTTGKPIKIWSRISPKRPAMYFELAIDTRKNEPNITKSEEIEWQGKDHGVKLEIEMEAKYAKGKQSVDDYLKQVAIANPHCHIVYISPDKEVTEFPSVTKQAPKEPKEIKPHPYGVELGMLIKMLKDTKANRLSSFLQTEFCRVSPAVSKEICSKSMVDEGIKPIKVEHQQIEAIFRAIQNTKIMSPPTDCLVPIGEEALIKGMKKEVAAEFYTAVTRPPAVYRGNPFQIECCTGDTRIQLEDGSIVPIKEFVENEMTDKNVFSMSPGLKIIPGKVLMVHKFKNEHKILKIVTRTGRELKLTANNEIPIIESGDVKWKKAEDAMSGDFIAVPRKISVNGSIPSILDILDETNVKVVDSRLTIFLMDKLKERYGTDKQSAKMQEIGYNEYKAYRRLKQCNRPSLINLKKMSNSAGLDFEEIKKNIHSIRIVDTKFTNPHTIMVPEISEDLLYVLGLLNSDGYISRKGIVFVNNDQYLHKMYCEKINSLFGLVAKRYKETESYICNKTLYIVLKQLRKALATLPNNLISAWLKGIVDGDGWVSLKEGKKLKEIGIATAKKEEAEFAQTMLLRIGILSKIEKQRISNSIGKIGNREIRGKKDKYNVLIRDLENIRHFHSLISFRQVKRSNRISEAIKAMEDITPTGRGDVIPIGRKLYELRKENDLFQYDMGFSEQTIRQTENCSQNMTRQNLQQIICCRELSGEAMRQMNIPAYSDILCDEIVSIDLIPNEEYVYDLTVETGNFVANNIIMHNCGLAFGGTLEKDELIKVLRFANRVPLLYQQSACASYNSIVSTMWRNYGLSQSKGALPAGPALVLVHMSSVWVPFTSEAKEAVAAYPEIIHEMKLGLQEVGRQLGIYIRKNIRAREQRDKANLFENYIPELADSLARLTGDKKADIAEALNKMLKKTLPAIMQEVKELENPEEKK